MFWQLAQSKVFLMAKVVPTGQKQPWQHECNMQQQGASQDNTQTVATPTQALLLVVVR